MYTLTDQGLRDYFLQWLEDRYVRQVEGKGLSANDFTDTNVQQLADAHRITQEMSSYHTLTEYGILNAYDKSEVDRALADKVDKVEGKELSDNNFTDEDKQALAALLDESLERSLYSTLAEYNIDDAYTKREIDVFLAGYVQQVAGKGLSTNDFTNEMLTALENLVQDVTALKAEEGQLRYRGNISFAELMLVLDAEVSDVYRISSDDAQGRAKAGDKFMWTGDAWEGIGSSGHAEDFILIEDCQILKASDIDALFMEEEEEESGG